MLYNITSEIQFCSLLKHETFKRLGASFHPVYSGWKGPGVYSLEPVFYGESGFVWKSELPKKSSMTVQMTFKF